VWHSRRDLNPLTVHLLGVLMLAVSVQAACSVAAWDQGDWLAYHVLMVAWTLAAFGALLLAWRGLSRDVTLLSLHALHAWTTVIGLLVVGLAVRGMGNDATGPLWSVGALLAMAALAGCQAVAWSRHGYVYASGLLVNAAGIAWWIARPERSVGDFVFLNILCLAFGGAAWAIIELALRRRRPPIDVRGDWLPFTHAASVLSLAALALMIAIGLVETFASARSVPVRFLAWPALVGLAIALVACLRDPSARFALPALYALGLVALGLAAQAAGPVLCWWLMPAIALYVLLTTVLWHTNSRWGILHDLLPLSPQSAWFMPAKAVSAVILCGTSVFLCLDLTAAPAYLGPLTVALVLPAVLLIATHIAHDQRSGWQSAALGLGVLVSVETGWAFLAAGAVEMLWLVRSGVLLTTLAPLTILYGVGLTRWPALESGWRERSHRWAIVLGGLSLVALAAVLGQETLFFAPGIGDGARPPGIGFIVAVAAAIVVMIGTALCLALLPELDLFHLSERGRTAYVYAAEVLLALVFAHLRLAAPWLFSGRLAQYWMFMIVGLAFLGAAAGEAFRRLRLPVLAMPLERTGTFLAILPVLGFWLRPASFGTYALLWFLVGLVYVFFSVTKRSLAFLLLAIVAADLGLWAILHENQLAFVQHPQLWLIPFAMTGLVAEYLNRDRLSRNQKNTIRYVSLSIIYLSSTAEIVLTGLGHDAIRAFVLVVLSLLGVFAGMMLRVRAFLFLGAIFLLLGIFTMIRHAALVAEDQGRIVWLVAGIVVGVAIFTLFAVLEKRRNDVLNLLKKLKDWE